MICGTPSQEVLECRVERERQANMGVDADGETGREQEYVWRKLVDAGSRNAIIIFSSAYY